MPRLRDRVQLMRPLEGADDYGNPAKGWTAGPTVYADIMERLGSEKLGAGRIESTKLAAITLWAADLPQGFDARWRVTARGLEWSIQSVAGVGRSGSLVEISATHGGAP